MPYRRRELWLLLWLAVAIAAGLLVGQWRSAFPDVAERLEALDADPPVEQGRPGPPAPAPGPLDLNRATPGDLQRLPGIGPALAADIVRVRERRGPFTAPDDLLAVPGMGPRRLERIRDLVSVRDAGRPE
jgi:competence ComEA-like helix-hairpin-helix protein